MCHPCDDLGKLFGFLIPGSEANREANAAITADVQASEAWLRSNVPGAGATLDFLDRIISTPGTEVIAPVGAIGGGGRNIVRATQQVDVSVRGTKDYARTLFKARSGGGTLSTIRDRITGRLKGVRNADGTAVYRPKRDGSTNVEIITEQLRRINIHVRP